MTVGRVPNADITQILELLYHLLVEHYCLITVIDSSPGIVQSVGERLISKDYPIRLVRGAIEVLVRHLLDLLKQDTILNEFDEVYLLDTPVSVDASTLERFPGEHLFENLTRDKKKVLERQMENLGAGAFLSDGVGVNCAFVDEKFVQTIITAGFELLGPD